MTPGATISAEWTARAALNPLFVARESPREEALAALQSEPRDAKDRFTEQERNFRVAALEIKTMVFADLWDALEGKEPRRARRNPQRTWAEGAPRFPTWEEPFIYVQIEYPLDENRRYAPPEQLADKTEALWWLSAVLNAEWGTKSLTISALQIMTRSAAFVRREGEVNPVIPLAFFDSYKAMSEAERAEFMRAWFSPVSHGDAYTEKDGRALPNEDASLAVEDGPRRFRAAAVFEVYPLMLDLDAGRAFFTIRAGLPWAGDMGSPATWTAWERETLWTALFDSFRALELFYKGEKDSLPDKVEVLRSSLPPEERRDVTMRPDAGTFRLEGADAELTVSKEEATATIQTMEELVTLRARGGRVFPLAFGNALADAASLDFVQNVHRLKLPRSMAKLKRWTDLRDEEIREHLETLGQDATVDRRPLTGNAYDYPKLELVPAVGKPRSEWSYGLTKEAERELRKRWGGAKGFLDRDPRGREAIYRSVADNRGNLLEIWLSWSDFVWPFFPDEIEKAKREVMAKWPERDPRELPLFADLDGDLKRKIARHVERLNLFEHGRAVMEALLGQVGRQRRNPVEISAEAFRVLLWPSGEVPDDWKETVNRTLGALMGLMSAWKAGGIKGEASFVGSWEYRPLGQGGHGEGVYVVSVTDQFVRSLKVFEHGGMTLRSGLDSVVYDFNRELPKEESKALNFVAFDAGRTFYHAAAGLTAQQRNLAHWLEREITLNRDPAPSARLKVKVTKGPETKEPRVYDRSFCPLLPEGVSFVGALGHFKRNAEAGRTLFGTAQKAGKTGGAHVDGLVAIAGYPLPPGRAHAARADVVRKTLEDLKAVVVDYLGGVIVGKLTERQRKDGQKGVQWLTLEEFMTLDEETFCRVLKLFFFLPKDWNARRRETFEKVTGYRTTDSVPEAEAAAWQGHVAPAPEPPKPPPKKKKEPAAYDAGTVLKGAEDGWRGYGPLPNRLYAALQSKKMERQELARIFGVTKGAVSQWLYGMKLGQNPAKAVRIPADLGALMVRWLETGQEPTKEELDGLASRKRSPARRGQS